MGIVLNLETGFGHGCTYKYLIIVVNIVTLLQSVAVPQTFVILR
jgi:hypothetical protein